MRKLVRLANAAEYLGIRTPTLRAWYLKRKNLDFVKAGRAVCVTEESIERFIAENLRSRVTLSHPIEQPRSQSSPNSLFEGAIRQGTGAAGRSEPWLVSHSHRSSYEFNPAIAVRKGSYGTFPELYLSPHGAG